MPQPTNPDDEPQRDGPEAADIAPGGAPGGGDDQVQYDAGRMAGMGGGRGRRGLGEMSEPVTANLTLRDPEVERTDADNAGRWRRGYEQEQADAARQEQADATQQQKDRNAKAEAGFRASGQKFYRDPYGDFQPVADEQGRPQFNETPWARPEGDDAAQGVEERRDRFGKTQRREVKVAPSADDPDDPNLYWHYANGDKEKAGHADDLAESDNPVVAAAARKHQERLALAAVKAGRQPLLESNRQAASDLDAAKVEIADNAQKQGTVLGLLAKMAQPGAEGETEDMRARRGALEKQQQDLQDRAQELNRQVHGEADGKAVTQGEMGPLGLAAKRGELELRRYDVAEKGAAFGAAADRRAAFLQGQGRKPEEDATWQALKAKETEMGANTGELAKQKKRMADDAAEARQAARDAQRFAPEAADVGAAVKQWGQDRDALGKDVATWQADAAKLKEQAAGGADARAAADAINQRQAVLRARAADLDERGARLNAQGEKQAQKDRKAAMDAQSAFDLGEKLHGLETDKEFDIGDTSGLDGLSDEYVNEVRARREEADRLKKIPGVKAAAVAWAFMKGDAEYAPNLEYARTPGGDGLILNPKLAPRPDLAEAGSPDAKPEEWRRVIALAQARGHITPEQAKAAVARYAATQTEMTWAARDQAVGSAAFSDWLQEHKPDVFKPYAKDGLPETTANDPRVREAADEWLRTRPEAGEVVKDMMNRFAGTVVDKTAQAVAGTGAAMLPRWLGGGDGEDAPLQKLSDVFGARAARLEDPRTQGSRTAKVAEMAGFLAPFVAGAGGAGAVARAAGMTEKGVQGMQLLAETGLMGAGNAQGVMEDARAHGWSQKEAQSLAPLGMMAGGAQALVTPVLTWANRLNGPARVAALRAFNDRLVTEVAKHAALGAAGGVAQTMGNNAIAKKFYDDNRSLFEGVPGVARDLGTAAGIISALTGIVERVRHAAAQRDALAGFQQQEQDARAAAEWLKTQVPAAELADAAKYSQDDRLAEAKARRNAVADELEQGGAGGWEDRLAKRDGLVLANMQVAKESARAADRLGAALKANREIAQLPDYRPSQEALAGEGGTPAGVEPTANKDAARAIMQVANGTPPEELTQAQHAALETIGRFELGGRPAVREEQGQPVISDAAAQWLRGVAPSAGTLVEKTEAQRLREINHPAPVYDTEGREVADVAKAGGRAGKASQAEAEATQEGGSRAAENTRPKGAEAGGAPPPEKPVKKPAGAGVETGRTVSWTDEKGARQKREVPADAAIPSSGVKVDSAARARRWLAEQGVGEVKDFEFTAGTDAKGAPAAAKQSPPPAGTRDDQAGTKPKPESRESRPPETREKLAERGSPGNWGMVRDGLRAQGRETGAATKAAMELRRRIENAARSYGPLFKGVAFDARHEAGTGGLSAHPDGTLRLHAGDLARDADALLANGRAEQLVREEAIHQAALKLEAEGKLDAAGIWKGLAEDTRAAFSKALRRSGADARELGHEFLRMLVQGRLALDGVGKVALDGVAISEDTVAPRLRAKIMDALRALRDYFTDLVGTLRKAGNSEAALREVERAVGMIEARLREFAAGEKEAEVAAQKKSGQNTASQEKAAEEVAKEPGARSQEPGKKITATKGGIAPGDVVEHSSGDYTARLDRLSGHNTGDMTVVSSKPGYGLKPGDRITGREIDTHFRKPGVDKTGPAAGGLKREVAKPTDGNRGDAEGRKGGKEIGKNSEGHTILEDATGVRSVLRDGVRLTEAVAIRPTRAGMEATVSRDREGTQFETAEELASREGKKKPAEGLPVSNRETPAATNLGEADQRPDAAAVTTKAPGKPTGDAEGTVAKPSNQESPKPNADEVAAKRTAAAAKLAERLKGRLKSGAAAMPRLNVDKIPQEGDTYQIVPKGDSDPLGYGNSGGKFYLTHENRWVAVHDEHEDAAREILGKKFVPVRYNDNAANEEMQLRRGWLRIVDNGEQLSISVGRTDDGEEASPTTGQLRELRDTAIENNRRLVLDDWNRGERTIYAPSEDGASGALGSGTAEEPLDKASPAAQRWAPDEQPDQHTADTLASFERGFNAARAGRGGREAYVRFGLARLDADSEGSAGGVGFDQAVRRLSLAFGKRIIFFKPSRPMAQMGLTAPDRANTILVNVDAEQPVHVVIGHELAHNLKAQRPELYADLRGLVARLPETMPADYGREKQAQGYTPEKIEQEWMGDVLGERLDEPGFWRKFFTAAQREMGEARSRTLARELAEFFNGWLGKLGTRMRRLFSNTHNFARDLDGLQKGVAGILARYAEGAERHAENPLLDDGPEGATGGRDLRSGPAEAWGGMDAEEEALADEYLATLPAEAKASRDALKAEMERDLPDVAAHAGALENFWQRAQAAGRPSAEMEKKPDEEEKKLVDEGQGKTYGQGDGHGVSRREQSGGELAGAPDAGDHGRVVDEQPEAGAAMGQGRGAGEEIERGAGSGVGRGRGGEAGGGHAPVAGGDLRAARRAGAEPRALTTSAGNYVITDADRLGEGGQTAKIDGNTAAIETLKAIEAEGRPATREEQAKLVRYVGWGGLKSIFKEPPPENLSKRRAELERMLTPEEFSAARRSVQDAHYTSPTVIRRGIYAAMARFGFTGGRMIEGGVGAGHFIGMMPAEMRANAAYTGVELDPITARIAKLIYPEADIHNVGFQEAVFTRNSFDGAVGNPPFGNQSLFDKNHREASRHSIHNYFILKELELLRPGGLMAKVVSHYFLDAQNPAAREAVAKTADFLGAIRLPNTAFKQNAGTDVTTDLVFFQKRAADAPAGDPAWTRTGKFEQDGESVAVNSWVLAHPEMVLGRLSTAGKLHGGAELTVEPHAGTDLGAQLDGAVTNLPEKIYQPVEAETKERLTAPEPRPERKSDGKNEIPDHVRVNGYFTDAKGRLHQRKPDVNMKRVAEPVEDLNESQMERVKAMVPVRDALNELVEAELSDRATDIWLDGLRHRLNQRYDAFVKKNGYLNQQANRRAFDNDSGAARVLALETDYDPGLSKAQVAKKGGETRPVSAKKAAIFSKRVNLPYREVTRVETPKEALLVSLNQRGGVDLEHMAGLLGGMDREAMLDALKGMVFNTPREGWQSKEQYLSGNVRQKLKEAQDALAQDGEAQWQENVDALKAVIPADINPADIAAPIGANWVAPDDYRAFARELTGEEPKSVLYRKHDGGWLFTANDSTERASSVYGTRRAGFSEIFSDLMNGRPTLIYDRTDDTPPQRVLNAAETALAGAKADEIRAKWGDWLWRDEERRNRLARIYNDTFNNYVDPHYDGAHLTLPGASAVVTLRPHQKGVAWRTITERRALYDHVVGAGKTFAGIASFMEMKRLGRVKKPLFAVPNHLPTQWRDDFVKLYPNANILMASPGDFTKEKRQRFFARIMTGDYDAVIVGHSQLKKLGVSPEIESDLLGEMVHEIDEAIKAMRETEGKRSRTVAQAEKAKERLLEKLKRLNDGTGQKDTVATFDELGIDGLMVDECFPYDTPILTKLGWAPIGEIVEEKTETEVYSFNSSTHALEWKKIKRWIPVTRRKTIVRVTHEQGHFTCTADHKIWTEQGYIKAGELTPDAHLQVLPTALSQDRADPVHLRGLQNQAGDLPKLRDGLHLHERGAGERREAKDVQPELHGHLARQATWSYRGVRETHFADMGMLGGEEVAGIGGADEKKQPDAQGIRAKEDAAQPERADVSSARGKLTDHPTAEDAGRIARAGDGAPDLDRSGETPVQESSALLQGGLGFATSSARGRGGRQDAQAEEMAFLGSSQNGGLIRSRVVGVEVLELGRDGQPAEGGGDYSTVYDIEVEDNHNFFSAGVLVSNCHEFKNLFYTTQMQRVAGLGSPEGSGRAFDLYLKTRYLRQRFGGKAPLVFATGTPISNSLVEMFTMQRYLQPDALEQMNLKTLDAWVKVFADVRQVYEVDATGTGYRMATRLASFKNVAELAAAYRTVADVVTMDDLKAQAAAVGERFPVPKVKGGKPQNIVADRTPEQAEYFGVEEPVLDEKGNPTFDHEGNARTKYPERTILYRVDNMPTDPREDNMLKLTNDARKAGLDMRLIDPNAPDRPQSKVNQAARRIVELYRKWAADKGTQLVFCDLSVPASAKGKATAKAQEDERKAEAGDTGSRAAKPETAAEGEEPPQEGEGEQTVSLDELLADQSKFSVYDDMKAKLVKAGIPAHEIAFIHDYDTLEKKKKLFRQVNSGEVRVLMGSTAKLGAGTNVQERIVGLHHLDAPWRPSDLEQREGRGIRQGNKLYGRDPDGFELTVNRYATKQTYDTRMWQLLEHKARGIEGFRKANRSTRTTEDVSGEAASASEMKAAASGDPLIQKEIELRNERAKLELQKNAWQRSRYESEGTMGWLAGAEQRRQSALAELAPLLAARQPKPEPFAFKDGDGKAHDKKEGLAVKLAEVIKDARNNQRDERFGEYRGFEFVARVMLTRSGEQVSELFGRPAKGGKDWRLVTEFNKDSVLSGAGIAQRLDNYLDGLDDLAKAADRRRDDELAKLAEMKAANSGPFKGEAELERLRREHDAVRSELMNKKKKPVAVMAKPPGDAALASGPAEETPDVADREWAGNRLALVHGNLAMAERIADRYRVPGQEAADLRQEARRALVQAAQAYDPARGQFGPFAGTVIRNRLKSLFNQGVRAARSEEGEPAGGEPADGAGGPREAAERGETAGLVWQMVERLPEKPRGLVEDFMAGKSFAQMGRERGFSATYAQKVVDNAQQAVAGMLRREGVRGFEDGALFSGAAEEQAADDRQAIKELMGNLSGGVPAEKIAEIYARTKDEPAGARTAGDPRLANISKDDATRVWMNAIDEARKAERQHESFAESTRIAEEALAKDEAGVRRGLLERMDAQEGFAGPHEVVAARLLAERDFAAAAGDPQKLADAAALAWGMRQSRGDTARTLAIMRDPWKRPAERHRELLGQAVAALTAKAAERVRQAWNPAEKSRRVAALRRQIAALEKDGGGAGESARLKHELGEAMARKDRAEALREEMKARLDAINRVLAGEGLTLADLMGGGVQRREPGAGNPAAPKFDLNDPRDAARAARLIHTAESNGFDRLFEWWIAARLSGLPTHVANSGSMLAHALYDFTAQRAGEAALNAAFFRAPDAPQWGEFPLYARAVGPAIRRAWADAKVTWDTERSRFMDDFLDRQVDLTGVDAAGGSAAIPGKAGRVIRVPLRAMQTMDDFFRRSIAIVERAGAAYRIAKAEGLAGARLEARITGLVNTPGSAANVLAVAKANDLTFFSSGEEGEGGEKRTTLTGSAINLARQVRNWQPIDGVKPLKFLLPFVLRATNMIATGLRKAPGTGTVWLAGRLMRAGLLKWRDGTPVAQTYGRPEMIRHMVEQILALGATAGLLWRAAAGDDDDDQKAVLLTGALPEATAAQRALDERLGRRPYTLRVGSLTLAYGRYEPFATALGLAADEVTAIKAARRRGATGAVAGWAAAGQSLMAQVDEKTMLRGVAEPLKAVEDARKGEPHALERYLGNFIASFEPNLAQSAMRQADPHERDTRGDGFGGALLHGLVPPSAPRAVDAYGDEREKPGTALSRLVTPGRAGEEPAAGRVDTMLDNWRRQNPDEPDHAPKPLTAVRVNGKERALTATERHDFAVTMGRTAAAMLRGAALDVERPTLADVERADRAFATARTIAKRQLFGATAREPGEP